MRLIALTALSSALILSVPAAAKTEGQSDNQQAPAAKPATPEKRICKRIPVSGSNIVERVCLTKEDWKKVEELG